MLTEDSKIAETGETDLQARLNFLQSFEFFEVSNEKPSYLLQHLDTKKLMPIALNMSLLTFRFGEVIQHEGKIPDGLYLIKSGMCKAVLRRVVTQKVNRHIQGKLDINERNDLFRRFDPERSLLDGFKSEKRMTQNAIYTVTEDGEPIRDCIVYDDVMEFS